MLKFFFDFFLHIIDLLNMWLTEVSIKSLLAVSWFLILLGLHLEGPFVNIIVRSFLATYLINGALLGFGRRVWLSFFQCFGNIILQLRLIWQSMRRLTLLWEDALSNFSCHFMAWVVCIFRGINFPVCNVLLCSRTLAKCLHGQIIIFNLKL